MDQATVLIISDDADFSRVVLDRWQGKRSAPAFTLMSSDVCRDLAGDGFDMAIVGAVRPEVLSAVFNSLGPAGNPVIFVRQQSTEDGGQLPPNITVLRQQEGWLDALVLISSEILRHGETRARAHRAEEAGKALQRQAALGRYMLEVRHTLNNALTSVMGPIVVEIFEGPHYGSIFGTITIALIGGGAAGPWIAGAIHDASGSYRLAFVLIIAGCVASAVAVWLAAPRKVRLVPGRASAAGAAHARVRS